MRWYIRACSAWPSGISGVPWDLNWLYRLQTYSTIKSIVHLGRCDLWRSGIQDQQSVTDTADTVMDTAKERGRQEKHLVCEKI